MDLSWAAVRYAKQRQSAKERGIEFELTFEEWCAIWNDHWERRGRGKDQLVMCRTRDQGPYRVGNVRLDTPKGNGADRSLAHRRPWMADDAKGTTKYGFKSYGNLFPKPDQALELAEEEYEWIPGE